MNVLPESCRELMQRFRCRTRGIRRLRSIGSIATLCVQRGDAAHHLRSGGTAQTNPHCRIAAVSRSDAEGRLRSAREAPARSTARPPLVPPASRCGPESARAGRHDRRAAAHATRAQSRRAPSRSARCRESVLLGRSGRSARLAISATGKHVRTRRCNPDAACHKVARARRRPKAQGGRRGGTRGFRSISFNCRSSSRNARSCSSRSRTSASSRDVFFRRTSVCAWTESRLA